MVCRCGHELELESYPFQWTFVLPWFWPTIWSAAVELDNIELEPGLDNLQWTWVGAWAWQYGAPVEILSFPPGALIFIPVLEKLNVAMKSLNYASAGSADTGSRGRDIYNSIWWDRSEPRGEYVGIILIKLWSFNTQLRFERHTCVHKLFLNMWGEQNHDRIVSFLLPNQTSCLVKITLYPTLFSACTH